MCKSVSAFSQDDQCVLKFSEVNQIGLTISSREDSPTTRSETSTDPSSVQFSLHGSEISLEDENQDDSVFSSNLNQPALRSSFNQSPSDQDHLSHPEKMLVERENERNLRGTTDEVNLVCMFINENMIFGQQCFCRE